MRSSSLPPGWLGKQALFQRVRSAGLRVDDILLDEFQKQGLMRPPLRVSRGRYGNPGYWSPQQADLLCALCRAVQRQGATSVAARCILPVWTWLYWGDEYGITLEQVQRVMHTWAQRMQHGLSRDRAHQLAADLIAQVGNAPKGGIQRAKRELTDLLSFPAPAPDDLLASFAYVFDPGKRPNGPQALPIVPEAIAAYIQTLWHGILTLAKGQSSAPGLWFWARHTLLWQLAEYHQLQPAYQQDVRGTPLASFYAEETVITCHQTACTDLAVALGAALLFSSPPHLPEHLRHETWEQRAATAHVTATPVLSPLWLPGKKTFMRALTIKETMTLS